MAELLFDTVAISDEEFRQISDLVYRHCGINLRDGKKSLVRARLTKWIQRGGFRSFGEYMQFVTEDSTGREFSNLIDSLSTNVTSFFREERHFAFLRKEFLPAVLERKQKEHSFRIRGWSAGCSSGEEPYSIAVTVLETIQGIDRWDLKILATDISSRVLEMARRGVYDADRIAAVPPACLQKYFQPVCVDENRTYQVGGNLKRAVMFRHLNLMRPWPITGPVDFIFCRNVMIYFDKPTQQNLIRRFWNLLDSGGILFTGHSESLTGIEHQFRYIEPTIYQKP